MGRIDPSSLRFAPDCLDRWVSSSIGAAVLAIVSLEELQEGYRIPYHPELARKPAGGVLRPSCDHPLRSSR